MSDALADRPAVARETTATGRVRILAPDRIAFHWGSTTDVVAWNDVIAARAVRNDTVITMRGRNLRVHCPLKRVVERLAILGLVQIRRGEAVNAAHIRRFLGRGRHRLVVELDSEVCLRVGRQFQTSIRTRFGLRSGVATSLRGGGGLFAPSAVPAEPSRANGGTTESFRCRSGHSPPSSTAMRIAGRE